jgi:hypothetical protein
MKVSYKNKVAVVQSEVIFEDDTRKEFLKIKKSQLLTSKDDEEIFDFIKHHACKNSIYNFVLHIDSGTLTNLIDLMAEEKERSKKTRKLIKKCKFVATYSNASSVRTLNAEKGTEIRFALSPISEVLSSIPDGSSTGTKKEIMLVVSDTVNPYYEEIYDFFTVNTSFQKVKLVGSPATPGLTIDMINELVNDGGYLLIAALDTEEEFNKFGAIVKSSNFKKQVHIIECTQPLSQGVKDLQATVSDRQTSSSGVCINGTEYAGLNTLLAYEKCAAALTVVWKCWEKLDEARVFVK